MILSFVRISMVILAAILLVGFLTMPVHGAEIGNPEIILREDGLLKSSFHSIVAGVGATVCVGIVFVIVWKQWEP